MSCPPKEPHATDMMIWNMAGEGEQEGGETMQISMT